MLQIIERPAKVDAIKEIIELITTWWRKGFYEYNYPEKVRFLMLIFNMCCLISEGGQVKS